MFIQGYTFIRNSRVINYSIPLERWIGRIIQQQGPRKQRLDAMDYQTTRCFCIQPDAKLPCSVQGQVQPWYMWSSIKPCCETDKEILQTDTDVLWYYLWWNTNMKTVIMMLRNNNTLKIPHFVCKNDYYLCVFESLQEYCRQWKCYQRTTNMKASDWKYLTFLCWVV